MVAIHANPYLLRSECVAPYTGKLLISCPLHVQLQQTISAVGMTVGDCDFMCCHAEVAPVMATAGQAANICHCMHAIDMSRTMNVPHSLFTLYTALHVHWARASGSVHKAASIKLHTVFTLCCAVTTFCNAPLRVAYPISLHHCLPLPTAKPHRAATASRTTAAYHMYMQ